MIVSENALEFFLPFHYNVDIKKGGGNMYSIGIFTNEQSLRQIMRIDGQMCQYANITYLPYTSLDHLKFLYEQNAGKFDAVLFSGSYPYNVVRRHFPTVEDIPHAYFNISDRDYYKLIAQLAVQHPSLDFSRVYFDRPEFPVDFYSIFQREDMPLLGTAPIDWAKVDAVDWYKPLQAYYKSLWDSGKVDLLVTRFASMACYFDENHIRHRYLMPAPESMEETFWGLITQLNTASIHDNAACIGLILSTAPMTPTARKEFCSRVRACNRQLGMPFLIYEENDHFEVTVNHSVLKDLTQQYTTCPVTAFLDSSLDFPVYVGWGCANNVLDAHRNAQRAVKEAMLCKTSASFLMTEDNTIIGPLSSTRRITYTDTPSAKLAKLSESVGISPLQLNKIVSVLRQKDTPTLSSEELSFYLNVTKRSASRILSKLAAAGVACVEYNRQLKLRGRPAKIYKIDLPPDIMPLEGAEAGPNL